MIVVHEALCTAASRAGLLAGLHVASECAEPADAIPSIVSATAATVASCQNLKVRMDPFLLLPFVGGWTVHAELLSTRNQALVRGAVAHAPAPTRVISA